MSNAIQSNVEWIRGPLFPLRRAFCELVFGDLNKQLFRAAEEGNSPAVRTWLDRGADIHADDDRALKLAARHKHDNTVALLLYYGADPTKLPADAPPRESYSLTIS